MPKVVDRDAYRKEMLEKSLHLFSLKGYAGVTMREIANEVGVSTGTLYHYFPTKECILEQLFKHIMETNVAEYLSRVEGIETPAERLAIMSVFWKDKEEYYRSVMLLAIDIFRNDSDNTTGEVFWKFSEYYKDIMSEHLGITPMEARSLFIFLLGLVTHSTLTPDHLPFDREIERLQQFIAGIVDNPGN